MTKIKILNYFVFTILFIAIFLFYTNDVIAETEEASPPCLFCTGSSSEEDNLIYKQEQQLLEKIKIIKSKYGESIDEITLLATILHKEGPQNALGSRYNENFDASKYGDKITNEKSWYDGVKGKSNEEMDEYISKQEEKFDKMTDLLDAAAVIMAESSSGGFNEESYKKALASDTSGTICGMAAASLGISVVQLLQGKTTRFDNLSQICTKGYIGANYAVDEVEGETEEEKKENRQKRKDRIAEDIIDLAHYYKAMLGIEEEEDSCVVTTPSSGDYTSWKQTDDRWKDLKLGSSSQTVRHSGCLVTSLAIAIAKSGTKITNLPSGYNSFDPGALVTTLNSNKGFDGAALRWGGAWSKIAPNWKDGGFVSVNTSNEKTLAKKVSNELSTKAKGKYQKYLILQIHHDGGQQHWVVVDQATSSSLTIIDPARNGNTISGNYSSWKADGYRVMYATDVTDQGSVASSSTQSSSVVTPADPNTFKKHVKKGFKHGRLPKNKVKYIVMHDTESGTDDIEKIAKSWGNGPVAAHFIVGKDGTIMQCVPLNKIAHHAGWGPSGSNSAFGISQERDDKKGADIPKGADYAMNAWSIGIEIVHEHGGGEYPAAQLKALDSLVAYIDKELGSKPEITDHKAWTGNPSTTRVKKQGQGKQDVDDTFPLSNYQNSRTSSATSEDACQSSDSLMQEFLGFLAHNEGDKTCNYRGQGEGTGYAVEVLKDNAGPTTAFGVTRYASEAAKKVGYTDFLTDLYAGCTNKEMIDKLVPVNIEIIATTYTDKQAEAAGVTLEAHERIALTSVNYGGVTLAKPIIAAIKAYGKDSEQVYRAFQDSFTNMNYADGLMRRRMSEYEIFMTGNFKAESTKYLGWSNIYSKAKAMSKSEAMSHWPTSRDE